MIGGRGCTRQIDAGFPTSSPRQAGATAWEPRQATKVPFVMGSMHLRVVYQIWICVALLDSCPFLPKRG